LENGTFADDFHVFGLYWDENQLYTYVDSESTKVLEVDFTKESLWKKGKFPSNFENIYQGRNNSAPFDAEFYLMLNVAVGGTNPYFPDDVDGKPWTTTDSNAVNKFYDAKDTWYSTWNGEDAAM